MPSATRSTASNRRGSAGASESAFPIATATTSNAQTAVATPIVRTTRRRCASMVGSDGAIPPASTTPVANQTTAADDPALQQAVAEHAAEVQREPGDDEPHRDHAAECEPAGRRRRFGRAGAPRAPSRRRARRVSRRPRRCAAATSATTAARSRRCSRLGARTAASHRLLPQGARRVPSAGSDVCVRFQLSRSSVDVAG